MHWTIPPPSHIILTYNHSCPSVNFTLCPLTPHLIPSVFSSSSCATTSNHTQSCNTSQASLIPSNLTSLQSEKNRHHILITRTLAGMMKLRGYTGTHRKRALTKDDLMSLLNTFTSPDLDNLVFLAIFFSSFHAFLRLGELTQADSQEKHSFRKIALHHSVKLTHSSFLFALPTHKADCFFERSMILIESHLG